MLQSMSYRPVQDMKLWHTKKMAITKGDKCSYFRSCAALPDGSVVFADENNRRLIIMGIDRNHSYDLELSDKPFDIESIGSNNIAVSYGNINKLEVWDLDQKCVLSKLKLKGFCSGLTHIDNKLYVLVFNHGIQVIDLGTLSVIKEIPTSDATFTIASCYDRLYYIDLRLKILFCINQNGLLIWKIKSENLDECQTLTIDTHGNVFATAPHLNKIISVSADGTRIQTLLDFKDGFHLPAAIHYDKVNKRLLICERENCNALLYSFI